MGAQYRVSAAILGDMVTIMSPLLIRRVGQALQRAGRCLERSGRFALDPWLPRACALCGCRLSQVAAGFCRHCRLSLPGRQRSRCGRCGLARNRQATDCTDCRQAAPNVDATCVLADYAAPLDRLIGALKFQGELALAYPLGLEMAIALRQWQANPSHTDPSPIALLIPIPLSGERLRERGYNQAAALAATLGRQCRLPVKPALARIRTTQAQSGLPMAARRTNVDQAFAVRPGSKPLPPHVALVDDVMTTGATLNAAAGALRRAGVRQITAVVAARTA